MKQINSNIKIIGDYKGSENPVECECLLCKHQWTPVARSLKNNQGCPKCSSSKGERIIYDLLKKYNIDFYSTKSI